MLKINTQLKEYCEKNNIARLSLFGSYSKGLEKEGSDYDLLIEFKPGKKPGYLNLARIQRELSSMLGKRVDLRTPEELSKYFRSNVIKEAEVKYEANFQRCKLG